MIRKFCTLLRAYKNYGWKFAVQLVWSKIFRDRIRLITKSDPVAYLRTVLYASSPKPDKNITQDQRVTWVIPPFGKGSGGHLNIFRFVRMLELRGIISNIIIIGQPQPVSVSQAKAMVREFFFEIASDFYLEHNVVPSTPVVIATGWQTAYYVQNFPATYHYYFVQDYEPYFYPKGSLYYLAESTYRLGFKGITAGTWLSSKLQADFGMNCIPLSFSYDRNLYKMSAIPRNNLIKRVFFYARPPTERRGFELGILALEALAKMNENIEIAFAGWDLSSYNIQFPYVDYGLLDVNKLPELYGECDVALILSFTNLSLLPLELMAAGVPVVCNDQECNRWLLNSNNAILCKPTVDEIAASISSLLNKDELRFGLIDTAYKFAQETSWDNEGDKLYKEIAGCVGINHE